MMRAPLFVLWIWIGLLASKGLAQPVSLPSAPGRCVAAFDNPFSSDRYKSIRPLTSEHIASKFNLSPQTMWQLSDFISSRQAMVFIRSFTPYYGSLISRPKSVDVKYKTLKSGSFRGLVGWGGFYAPKNCSHDFLQKYELVGQVDGYTLLRDSSTQEYLSSDIDLQGVYVANRHRELKRVDTNSGQFWDKTVEFDLPDSIAQFLKHGANDDFRDADGRPKRLPNRREVFYAIIPSGSFFEIRGSDSLQKVYKMLNIPWIYVASEH